MKLFTTDKLGSVICKCVFIFTGTWRILGFFIADPQRLSHIMTDKSNIYFKKYYVISAIKRLYQITV